MLDEVILYEFSKLPKTKKEAIEQNIEFYFTNQPCKYGHVFSRYSHNGCCVACNIRMVKKSKREGFKSKYKDSKIIIDIPLGNLPKTRKEALLLGSKFFFTGEKCEYGHLDKRYTSGRRCFTCLKNKYKIVEKFDRETLRGSIDDYLLSLPSSQKEAIKLNSDRYFTGIRCPKNHLCERFLPGPCVLCAKEISENKKDTRKNELLLNRKNLDVPVELLSLPSSRKDAIKNNNKFYFTGVPCKHGHFSKRTTKERKCCECSYIQSHEWRKNNPENRKISDKKYQEKKKLDPKFRINQSMSSGIVKSLKHGKQGLKWLQLVEFTLEELIIHLSNQFRDGMTLENYGSHWHLDHIKPLSLCDTFREAWSLNNLQPLLAKENFGKCNRYIGSPNNKIIVSDEELLIVREWPDIEEIIKNIKTRNESKRSKRKSP